MRPWTALFFVLVLASGAASGFFVGRSQARGAGDIPNRADVLEAFAREVGLDDEQRAAFQKVFEANHPRFVAVKKRAEVELAPIRSDVRAQLRALLRDEQKARFDEYCNKRDRQRQETLR